MPISQMSAPCWVIKGNPEGQHWLDRDHCCIERTGPQAGSTKVNAGSCL